MTEPRGEGSALRGLIKLLVIVAVLVTVCAFMICRAAQKVEKENEEFAAEAAGYVFDAVGPERYKSEQSYAVRQAANYGYYCGQVGISRSKMKAILDEAAAKALLRKTP